VIDDNSTTLLYPNPANQTLNIKTDGNIAHIEIYDIFGRKLLGAFATDAIDISNLPVGTYYVRIENDLHTKTETLQIIR
jgi:allantoicase